MCITFLSTNDFHVIKKLDNDIAGIKVYLSRFLKDDSKCVLKIIKQKMLEPMFPNQQFKMEIKALKNLNHESIPYLYGVYNTKSNIILHQEYVAGSTLRLFLQVNKISKGSIFEICYNQLRIVYLIQTKGYIHRDIKPSNIMIQTIAIKKNLNLSPKKAGFELPGAPKNEILSDFGGNKGTNTVYQKSNNIKACTGYQNISSGNLENSPPSPQQDNICTKYKISQIDFGYCFNKFNEPETRIELMNKICGTKGYIAPEIILANTIEKREALDFMKIDMFSVGIVLYEMITKKNPFVHKDWKQVFRANAQCNINWEHERLADLDGQELELLKGLCSKEPNDRFSFGEALAHPVFSMFENQGMDEDRNDDLRKFRDQKM